MGLCEEPSALLLTLSRSGPMGLTGLVCALNFQAGMCGDPETATAASIGALLATAEQQGKVTQVSAGRLGMQWQYVHAVAKPVHKQGSLF